MWTKKRVLIAALASVMIIAAGVAFVALRGSSMGGGDHAASHSYLYARYRFGLTTKSDLAAVRSALDRFVARVANECPYVLRGAPSDRYPASPLGATAMGISTRGLLLLEAAQALSTTVRRERISTILAFASTIQHLNWSNANLTKLVQSFADKEQTELTLRVPRLCADAKKWVASGFRRLSTTPMQSSPTLDAISEKLSNEVRALGYQASHPERAILQLVRRYEAPRDRDLGIRVEQLEETAGAREYRLWIHAMSQLEHALGLPTRYTPVRR